MKQSIDYLATIKDLQELQKSIEETQTLTLTDLNRLKLAALLDEKTEMLKQLRNEQAILMGLGMQNAIHGK